MTEDLWKRDMETRVTKLERDGAVEAERYGHIEKRLDKIDQHVSRIVWLIIAAIITGFMTFIMSGGLAVAQ